MPNRIETKVSFILRLFKSISLIHARLNLANITGCSVLAVLKIGHGKTKADLTLHLGQGKQNSPRRFSFRSTLSTQIQSSSVHTIPVVGQPAVRSHLSGHLPQHRRRLARVARQSCANPPRHRCSLRQHSAPGLKLRQSPSPGSPRGSDLTAVPAVATEAGRGQTAPVTDRAAVPGSEDAW